MRFTKSFTALLFIALTTLGSLPAGARDGGFSGNGADEVDPANGAAWFLGKEPVKWCLQASQPIDAPKLQAAFFSSLKIWKTYLFNKGLDSIVNVDQGLALNVEQAAECTGYEELAIIASPTRPHLDFDSTASSLAGTYKTSYDKVLGRGKGIIWINSASVDWPVFPMVMLQQVGKILGNGPVEGTIMQVGFLEQFGESKAVPTSYRGRIDFTRELVHTSRQYMNIQKHLTKEETLELQRLIGVNVESKWASLEIGLAPHNVPKPMVEGIEARLAVVSSGGLIHVPIQFTQTLFSSKVSEQTAFKRVQGAYSSWMDPVGISYSGFATLPNGRRLPVIMNRNEDKALEIIAINAGVTVEMFSAKAYGAP